MARARSCAFGDVLRASFLDRVDQTSMTFLHRKSGMHADEWTGGALLQAAEAQAAIWRAEFGEGRFVLALSLPHGSAFVTALIAALICDICVVALPPSKPGDPKVPHIVQDCGARAVITTKDGATALEKCLTQNGPLACPIYSVDGTLLRVTEQPAKDVALRDDTILVQYTSGSTRLPKGVEMSGRNILENSALVARTWGLGQETVVVNWMPHYHDMGLMGCILFPILFGGTSVQMSPFDAIRKPLAWLQAVQDHGGTITGGPAFIFAECLKRISPADCIDLDLSSLKQVFCGAEPVPAELLPAFQKRFEASRLPENASFACYGMAEQGLFIAGAQLAKPGKPYGGLAPCRLTEQTRETLKIASADGHPVDDAEEGEIWVCGASTTAGYLNLDNETAQALVQSGDVTWLRTGDLGRIHGDDLFVTGRIKDMLIVNGRNVAATEVEWLAASFDDALNRYAAAVFAPDTLQPAQAVLLIELIDKTRSFEGGVPLRKSIEQAVRGALGVHLVDIRFLPRGSLDKTSSGKVRRNVAAKQYATGSMTLGLGAEVMSELT